MALPECLLGVDITLEETFGGQLDTQHTQDFQFSLCSSNRNQVCIQSLETSTTLPHHEFTTLSVK